MYKIYVWHDSLVMYFVHNTGSEAVVKPIRFVVGILKLVRFIVYFFMALVLVRCKSHAGTKLSGIYSGVPGVFCPRFGEYLLAESIRWGVTCNPILHNILYLLQ